MILCGGKGLRYNNERPKGLAMIGKLPIVHHVMITYSLQGFNDFVLILGYKGQTIVDYFGSTHHDFNIKYEFVNENTKTGGALKLAERHNNRSDFLCTYCDSLSNVSIPALITTHNKSDNIVTLTAVKPNHIYGVLTLTSFGSKVKKFEEKPRMNEWINGGYFIFTNEIFKYILKDNDRLEEDVLPRIVKEKKVGAYLHDQYWDTINTLKDEQRLNEEYSKEPLPPWYNIKHVK